MRRRQRETERERNRERERESERERERGREKKRKRETEREREKDDEGGKMESKWLKLRSSSDRLILWPQKTSWMMMTIWPKGEEEAER
jgi:hypothetical protein